MVVFCLGDGVVHIVGDHRGEHAQDAHHKYPHQHLHLHGRVLDGQQDKRHQGHAGHAVGLKAVGGGAYAVAGVVARAVGYHARVARVVLANLEHHLHQVAAYVGNLGEDAAGDAQGTCTQRLAYGKAYEAAACQVAWHKEQDGEHEHQLNADEHHAYAHAGRERNVEQGQRLAAQRGKCHAGVGIGVHAHTIPRHGIAAQHAHNGPAQYHEHVAQGHVVEYLEVEQHCQPDEQEQHSQKLALLLEIGGACLEDNVAYLKHRLVGAELAYFHELVATK